MAGPYFSGAGFKVSFLRTSTEKSKWLSSLSVIITQTVTILPDTLEKNSQACITQKLLN